ncbi:uncharacterized protein LOC107044675 [Diachasma alloeum]|uniref:uncharacterized protein LOC107044675 n=1 Tax=Diachasma alloeum TaxID=454923 RepID=UPI0007382EF8|nr:uncharacterized protein LOC107044675 [Diachasma alloeum]
MGIDEDLVTVLRDLVEFLETLCDVKLPESLENVRSDLLRRSRTSLELRIPNSTSPEPYLEMKPGKGKALVLPKLNNLDDTNLTEYIDADHQATAQEASECQNEYESFGNAPASPPLVTEKDDAEEQLRMIYRSFSAEQTRSKCHKCGPLQQLKDERNIFMKAVLRERPCWVGLVGTYLLTYENKDAKKPKEISSIRGFSARPAPSLMITDPDRSKSVFEVFSPGSKTLQYIGRAPKDMEQWVAVINRLGTGPQTEKASAEIQGALFEQLVPSFDSNSTLSEEQYQDIGQVPESCKGTKTPEKPKVPKAPEKDEKSPEKSSKTAASSSPPPLPARIPRRLPSLPQTPAPRTPAPDEITEEKDDIYYTIEDMKAGMTYINLKPLSKKTDPSPSAEKTDLEMYDDIQGTEPKPLTPEKSETYDEVGSAECKKRENTRDSPKKKSFFDRFKGQKESPKKEDSKKKEKQNVIETSRTTDQELPTYDDVRGMSPERRDVIEEQENYTCPPAPRPVYSSPPLQIEEEIYDDIGHMRETERVESPPTNDNCEFEHYQVPRAQDPIDLGQLNDTNEEELYDDVAIRDQFRARQRDSACSSSSSERAANNVAKVWSRFASGKRNSDRNGVKKNESEEGLEGSVESGEDGNDPKVNKFHKLKSKMEHALNITGKPPIPPFNSRCDGH